MPRFDIVREFEPSHSFRTAAIRGKFDIVAKTVREHFSGEIPLDWNWQIGVIVGPSGTGKSTIAKELFPEDYIRGFEYSDRAIIEDMPGSVDAAVKMFNAVGFNSPPSWLKPYGVLSNGEKMRVDLARALLHERPQIVFDEFTSVVDRNVAQIGSFAVAKAVRRSEKRFIAVSCHDDILPWLQPDWVFYTDRMEFQKKTSRDPQSRFRSISAAARFGAPLGSITI